MKRSKRTTAEPPGIQTRESGLKPSLKLPDPKVNWAGKPNDRSRLLEFLLPGNCIVEAALIEHWNEMHICISTMAGCYMGCRHCATTYSKVPFIRVLTFEELKAMGLLLIEMATSAQLPVILSFSGHGEPLLNWAAVKQCAAALEKRVDKLYVTTIGIPSVFKKIISDGQAEIAFFLSLHGSSDKERRVFIPSGPDRSDIDDLFAFGRNYMSMGGRVVLNYMLAAGNASEASCQRVASHLKTFEKPGEFRLTDYTDIGRETGFKPLGREGLKIAEKWEKRLSRECPGWDIRFSKLTGYGLGVSCGQLRAKLTEVVMC